MKVTKLLQRATGLLLALAMLFSFPAGVFSEGTGSNSKEVLEIPEDFAWRTLTVELEPFKEDQKQTEEAEAARLEEKIAEADRFLNLMLSHSAEPDEEPSEPVITVRGWMPEGITAKAELISYTEKDLYAERALMMAEVRFYDAEGQIWSPELPVTICIEGDALEEVRAAKMDPTVYVYEELPQDSSKPEERSFSVEAFSAARSAEEEKNYDVEREDMNMDAEVCERALVKVEEVPKAACFEIETDGAVRFALTARQPDRTFSAASEDGAVEMAVIGALPRDLSAAVAPAAVEVDAGALPGEVLLAWDLSLVHAEEPDYLPDRSVKVVLRDLALEDLLDGDWELQLWQLREGADPVRVKGAVFQEENLRFSADSLSTFVVVKAAVERSLTATDGKTYAVRVSYDSNAGIPADAVLEVKEISLDDKAYVRYLLQGTTRIGKQAANLEFARMFDIAILDPKTGEAYKPNQNVTVSVELLSDDLSECAEVNVLYLGEQTKIVPATAQGNDVSFETDEASSVYALMGVAMERVITAGDGETYEVSVSYDKSAGIPAGAELEVRELVGEEYQQYLTKTAEFLSREEEQLVFARFFDITIVKDGVVYEPNHAVSVSIRLVDRPATRGELRVVHFGEETELLENSLTEDGCLKFDTESFSVYAITDEDGNVIVPRAFYDFYDGDVLKGRQIIKNQGTLTEITHNEPAGQVFLGWYIYNNDGTWGEQVFFDTPIQVIFGREEAAYGNSVVVPHVDENDKTNHVVVKVKTRYTSDFATVYYMTATTSTTTNESTAKISERIPMAIGETSTVYQIPDVTNEAYTIQSSDPNYTFVGWSDKKPDRVQDYYNDTVSANRLPITSFVAENQQRYLLYPVFMKAHWLIFKSGPIGSGAEYIAPAFVINGKKPTDVDANGEDKVPDDPSWRGYKFLYWTTTPTFDAETGELIQFEEGHEPPRYNFNQPLTGDTVLYGYWESGYSTYTVIYWKQSVTDAKDAAPQNRTYEFEDQETRDAKVGAVVNLTDADKNMDYNGFHHKEEQDVQGDVHVDSKNATVASSGATVLNVYYDRDLMTMQFYEGTPQAPAGGYNDPVWTTGGKTVITYTGLYGQSLQQNGYNWPSGTWQYFTNPNDNSQISGMSYLGQFVFPDRAIGKFFRAYKTGKSGATTIEFFLQNPDGSYPTSRSDYGEVGSAGTFNFTDKYDGYMVSQYRRYYMNNGARVYVDASGNSVSNPNDAWAEARVGGSTPLTAGVNTGVQTEIGWFYEGGGESVYYGDTRYLGNVYNSNGYNRYPIVVYNGNGNYSTTGQYIQLTATTTDNSNRYTQYGVVNLNGSFYLIKLVRKVGYQKKELNLEIRYARRNYNISYFDSMDGQGLTTLLMDGSTVQKKNGVLYGMGIENFYPDPSFEPQAKEPGWDFNGRWYSDQGLKTQIFFHDLTAEDQVKLWYYIDTSGEKIYTDRIPTDYELAMTLENDGRAYDLDKAEVIKTMPNRNLALYAGFTYTWYWIKIDPNGGYLNKNDPALDANSTYFWLQYGSKIKEYPTARTFVRDDAGTWYYHYDEFNEEDPNGAQPKSRKAYYTQNAAESTDGLHYRPIANDDEGYEFAGWYLVDDTGASASKYQRFNFDETFVKGNMILRAMWKQKGAFQVYYSTAKAVDPSGNTIAGMTVTGEAPVDDFRYANDSTIVVLPGVMTPHPADNIEYDFMGWYINNGVYAAGEVFEANPYLVERHPEGGENAPYDTFILYPVFQAKGEGNGDHNRTMLVLDANGGSATPGYVLDEGASYNADRTQVYFAQNDLPLNMDVELPVELPGTQEGLNVFTKEKAEFLGWAFSRDAKTPAFVAGQIVGVDNDQGGGFNGKNGNILYAVWRQTEVTVRVRLIDADSSVPISGAAFTLKDSNNVEIPGTEGGIISGSDGYLAKGTVRDFNIKTPAVPNTTTTSVLTETSSASGYIPLEAPVVVTVDFDGTIKYHLQGDAVENEAIRVEGDIYMIVVKEDQAICKVVHNGEDVLFANLRDAVAYAKTVDETTPVIQMMLDYTMPNSDFVTITAEDNIAITTASKEGKNPYHGEGTVATITRGDSGASMFTVHGGSFTTYDIILDGGSLSNKSSVTSGGIISVDRGGSLTVNPGTVLQNSRASSNTDAESHGGAIAASGAGTHVEITGTANDPIEIKNSSAKHCGGGVYVGAGASLLMENVSVTGCTAYASGQTSTYGGGGIAVVNGANDAGNPDAVIRNTSVEGCTTDGLGGGLLVSNAAATVETATFGSSSTTPDRDSALSGGGISASANAHVSLSQTEIYGCTASTTGGAMSVLSSVVSMSECTVIGNTASTGAGIYANGASRVQLYDAPNFGGTGANADGTLNMNGGNHATGSLNGETNGLAPYAKARQDIYLSEAGTDPATLEILGEMNTEPGSIWVWAESENHYQSSKPFAVVDLSITLSDNSYKAFRNAREDRLTNCSGDYLTGQNVFGSNFIFWTGGTDVVFKKIDGSGIMLANAEFTLYQDAACAEPFQRRGEDVVAVSVDGIVTFEKLSSGLYYMKETSAPEGCVLSENVYVILVGDSWVKVPDAPEADSPWTTVLSNITQADIDAQLAGYEEAFERTNYAIFMIDNITGKANKNPDIARQGIMNESDSLRPVILSKIDTLLKPLKGAKFIIRRFDGSVVTQLDPYGNEIEEFESDESGVFFVGRLPYGTYFLEEYEAPSGHSKPTHYFVFQVTAEGVKGLKSNDGGEDTFEITNTLTEPNVEDYLIPETPNP